MRLRKILRQRGYSQRVKNAAIKTYLREKREARLTREALSNDETLKEEGQSSPEVSS